MYFYIKAPSWFLRVCEFKKCCSIWPGARSAWEEELKAAQGRAPLLALLASGSRSFLGWGLSCALLDAEAHPWPLLTRYQKHMPQSWQPKTLQMLLSVPTGTESPHWEPPGLSTWAEPNVSCVWELGCHSLPTWVLSSQLCLTLCDLLGCSPPGSVHRIFQARILEWVAPVFKT